jgi:predicted nuclease of predicted toxin-antitoxin system
MNERLLVDECLTPELVPIACEFGFEAYHVAHIGLSGEPDRIVFQRVMNDNFLFVTNDREDWNALISRVDLHAGLLVIRPRCRREVQKTLFRTALVEVRAVGGLLNKVLEIDENADVAICDLPNPLPNPVISCIVEKTVGRRLGKAALSHGRPGRRRLTAPPAIQVRTKTK